MDKVGAAQGDARAARSAARAAALLGLVLAMLPPLAASAPVTYSTTTSQLCVGAPGCGVSSQTFGGAVTVTYTPVSALTVDASPQSFSSLGEISIACVGGGANCANQSLAGLNLFINIAQTAPTSGFASISGGVITGTIRGTASTARVTWSVSAGGVIGPIRYAIADNALALVPPATNAGRTSIQAVVTDETQVFGTDSSQLCIGAPGCGVNEQTLGGVIVRHRPASGSRIEAFPASFASFGRIEVACVDGSTTCASTSLANLNLYLNITQAAPVGGNASLPAASFTNPGGGAATVGGAASAARLQWAGTASVAIGPQVYRIADAPLAIAPASTNSGATSIQGLIVRDPLFANGFE
jgi:hypothetical protein